MEKVKEKTSNVTTKQKKSNPFGELSLNGRTINQVRKKYKLEPIEDGDKLLVSKSDLVTG